MKCSKCGEECRENQAFCLRCGTPIQVVPDFNLIEAELANSVGKLMKEEKQKAGSENKDKDLDYLEDEQYVTKNYIPREKRVSQTGGTRRLAEPAVTQTDFLVDGTGFSEQTAKSKRNSKNQSNRQEDIKREKKIFKIKLAIFSIFVIIILTIAVLLLKGVSGTGSKESFASKYNQGYDYYTAKAYNEALIEFLAAKEVTDSKEDKIKVNKSLLATYEKLGSRDTDMIEILKELIEL